MYDSVDDEIIHGYHKLFHISNYELVMGFQTCLWEVKLISKFTILTFSSNFQVKYKE